MTVDESADSVAAVVLAAGASSRFAADRPKQLAEFHGESMVRRTLRRLASSGVAHTWVVTGRSRREVEAATRGCEVTLVHNARFEEGLATSVRAAVEVLRGVVSAAIFVPCDQPWLEAATVDRLLSAWRAGAGIAVPVFRGRRGAPVLFDRRYFDELAQLEGDRGGRQLLERHPGEIVEVEVPSPRQLDDFDTVEQMRELLSAATGEPRS
jgi:molybdenum cofactor cytidylyltransferase